MNFFMSKKERERERTSVYFAWLFMLDWFGNLSSYAACVDLVSWPGLLMLGWRWRLEV